MAQVYYNHREYLQSCTTIDERIAAADAIISSLLLEAAGATSTTNISEYSLDDGQVKIKAVYNGVNQINAAIKAFENYKTYYENKKHGRTWRNIPGKNFI